MLIQAAGALRGPGYFATAAFVLLLAGTLTGCISSDDGPRGRGVVNETDLPVVVRFVGEDAALNLAVPPHSSIRLTAPAGFGYVDGVAIFTDNCRLHVMHWFGPDEDGAWRMGGRWIIRNDRVDDSDEAADPGWPTGETTTDCTDADLPTR